MSPEPAVTSVTAVGPIGVVIEISDNNLVVLASGTERVRAQLRSGLYSVRWRAFDYSEERIIRVTGDGPAETVRPSRRGAAARPISRSDRSLSKLGGDRLSDYRSAIVVIELPDPGVEEPELARGVRLYDIDDVAMRSDRSELEAAKEDLGTDGLWAVRMYPVQPGVYRLRYVSDVGDTIDQSVFAFDGRRTLILLRKGKAQALSASPTTVERNASFDAVETVGVAPSRIGILTTRLGGHIRPTPAGRRLADYVGAELTDRGGPLDPYVLKRALAPTADPMVRLCAAATLVREQLCQNPEGKGTLEPKVRADITGLLRGLPSNLPDVSACRTWLALRGRGQVPTPELVAPPMTSVAWDAVTTSPNLALAMMRNAPSLRGASRSEIDAGPWLAWRASGAKLGVVASPQVAELDAPVVRAAATRLAEHLRTLEIAFPLALSSAAGLGLSPTAIALVGAAIAIGLHRSVAPNPATVGALAAAAGGREGLVTALRATNEELAGLSRPRGQGRASSAQPPAFRRPITVFDDPQKGRFGGRSEGEGYSLSVRFTKTDDAEWVGIELVVRAPDITDDGATVAFYLHDTFDPDVYVRRFRKARASLTLHVFGGFTVGAWLQKPGIELELDLAEVEGAPTIIRQW